MVAGEKNETLVKFSKRVIQSFNSDKIHKSIALFLFKPMIIHGCGGHPDVNDQKLMAEQMNSFFKKY